MSRALLAVSLLGISTVASAAPPKTVQLTKTQLRHSAEPVLAAGGPGFAVVWEEMVEPGGKDRHIAAAIVGDDGKVAVAAKRLLVGGAMPNELTAMWNGTAFTIVICNDSWGEKKKLVWGTLATTGAFTKQGEHVFDTIGGIQCRLATAAADTAGVIVTTKAEAYNDNDEMTDRDCESWRVTLAGGKATLGKAAALCDSFAADATWYAGTDEKERVAFVDKANKTTLAKKLDVRPVAVAVNAGKFGWVISGKKDGFAIQWADAPFKKAPKVVAFEKAQFTAIQANSATVTKDDGLVVAAGTPTGFEMVQYKADGTVAWSGSPGKHVMYQRCAAGAGATAVAACVWTDDVKSIGEVRITIFGAP